jgi:hypothetical protein
MLPRSRERVILIVALHVALRLILTHNPSCRRRFLVDLLCRPLSPHRHTVVRRLAEPPHRLATPLHRPCPLTPF